ncbi:MAG: hypothetical protein IJ692_02065 [Alloprevotella sp.]|nr:hypothetical protein [Alloprevotella sp.]
MIEEFVLTLPLKVESWQADILNKRYEHLRRIYNTVQRRFLRHYIYLSQQNVYRQCKDNDEKRAFWENHPITFKDFCDKNGNPAIVKFPYTYSRRSKNSGKKASNGISDFVPKFKNQNIGSGLTYGSLGINGSILEELGLRIQQAWEKRIYSSKSKRISFKEEGDLNTFGCRVKDGFSGFVLDLTHMMLSININGRQRNKALFIHLPINTDKKQTDYEMYALKGGLSSVRKIIVSREYIRGRYKYYVQLTIKGEKPQKNRSLGKGTVGIDVGPSTIAVSSLSGVSLDKLADKCDDIEHDLWRINRKMDRSRRATNPNFFNSDGTFIKRKTGECRKWFFSNRYKRLKLERRELYRKQAAIRKQQHIDMANAMLSQGDNFIVENNPIDSWAKRAKKTKKGKNGKIRCKRRFGKSIAHHAPAMFVCILQNKVRSLGGEFHKAEIKNAATQFDFTNGEFTKHELNERTVTLSDGRTHQRDMLSAFNLQHLRTASPEDKDYDIEQMEVDYPIFCVLEQKGIAQFKETRHKERDVAYFLGASHKKLKFSSANRHNGGVGRNNCNFHAGRNVANAGIKSSTRKNCESLESVLLAPNDYHHSDHQHHKLDGL